MELKTRLQKGEIEVEKDKNKGLGNDSEMVMDLGWEYNLSNPTERGLTKWNETRLIENKEFMVNQRSRMLYKELVLDMRLDTFIEDYLEDRFDPKGYYKKGRAFLCEIINFHLNLELSVEELVSNKRQAYDSMMNIFGVQAFTVMMVRQALATIFGVRHDYTSTDSGKIGYSLVPKKIEDWGAYDEVVRFLQFHAYLNDEAKNEVLTRLEQTEKMMGIPFHINATIEPIGHFVSRNLTYIHRRIRNIRAGYGISYYGTESHMQDCEITLGRIGINVSEKFHNSGLDSSKTDEDYYSALLEIEHILRNNMQTRFYLGQYINVQNKFLGNVQSDEQLK